MNFPRPHSPLDPSKVVNILKPDGILSRNFKNFEFREQQERMMQDIIHAYNQNCIALIEAATGTGKSLAYLIPALLWALQQKEKTVISTHTIALQEQLLQKDIPFLTKALNLSVKTVLVKGIRNYLCLRKFEEVKSELLLLPKEEVEEIQKIDIWIQNCKEGSRSTLPFVPSGHMWEKVCAESDVCNGNECPYFKQCYFFKARREASDAQVLIVNHHLLFIDLMKRAEVNNYKDAAILPNYTRIILDEAHHAEEIATEHFASRLNHLEILKILGRLSAERGNKAHGKIPQLKEKLQQYYKTKSIPKEINSLLGYLNIDLPGLKGDLLLYIAKTFDLLEKFLSQSPVNSTLFKENENKLRILEKHLNHPSWTNDVLPVIESLINSLEKYVQVLNAVEEGFKHLDDSHLNESTKGIRFEISALANRLLAASQMLEQFSKKPLAPTQVRWIEAQMLKTMINVHIIEAELDVSKILVQFLFQKYSTVILCSATLTANQEFQFIRQRLGINLLADREVIESKYDSPFDFKRQTLLITLKDMPNPSEDTFIPLACERIWEAVEASRGNAFILFTSYQMLEVVYERLLTPLKQHRYHTLKQGEDNRQSLLKRFKTQDRSILFGTDSFWEGVDVAGEALRCVIIVKLPFRVPSEPMTQARCEAIHSRGGNSFDEYSLPTAIVKFKQGFGRLIRNKKDRGCIVCLDSRLITKSYGKQFIQSLPPCRQTSATIEDLKQLMSDFYRRTFDLTR